MFTKSVVGRSIVIDSSAFVVIASDRVLAVEPLHDLIAALATLLRETAADPSESGHQTWLCPSRATVLFGPTPLTSAVLKDLGSAGGPVTAALVSLYQWLDTAGSDAKTMPLTVQFQPRPSDSFRFVFGQKLDPDNVERALRRVPLVLGEAEKRLERNKQALKIFGDAGVPEQHRAELVHLYANPTLGWEMIA